MAKLLLGKEVSAALNEKIKKRTELLRENGVEPVLAVVRVGEKESDLSYERGIRKRCETLGVRFDSYPLPADVSEADLIAVLEQLNKDDKVHGVILFRPLPKYLNAPLIENTLVPSKDADCMTVASLAGIFTGKNVGFPPCTPQACIEILDYYGIDCTGKKVVVVGRSLVVGKPLSMLLLQKNATVTICHSLTEDLASVTREADILFVAIGHSNVIHAEHFRPGQIVFDVGIHVDENGKLCGDINPEEAEPVVSALTPVPGGVGSVTTSVLISHVVDAAERSAGLA